MSTIIKTSYGTKTRYIRGFTRVYTGLNGFMQALSKGKNIEKYMFTFIFS